MRPKNFDECPHSKTMIDARTNKTFFLILSAVLSVVLHALLLGLADRIPFGSFPLNPPPQEARPRRIRIQTVDLRDRVFEQPLNRTDPTANLVTEAVARSSRVRDIFKEQDLLTPPKPKLTLEGLGQNVGLPTAKPAATPQPPAAPAPKIIQIEADDLFPERLDDRRPVIPSRPRRDIDVIKLPSLAATDGLRTGTGGILGVGMKLSMPKTPLDPGKIPTETPDNDTMAGRDRPDLPLPDLPGMGDEATPVNRDDIDAIDELLDISMVVYEPPTGDGYFRIDIATNPRSDRLRAIPKDILFLVDCSNSITPAKLAVFRDAVTGALEYLNRRDRFNVVSFRVKPSSLFETYVPVTQTQIERGQDYVRRLQRGGLTDVYAGLSPFVAASKTRPERPLNVFLFTDGESTVKDRMDNQTMLRRIAGLNRHNASIYATSVGKGANRFLLDLLAYSNRGRPLHRDDLDVFENEVVEFVGAHTDIIVADLAYTVAGGLQDEIYPRKLPHLYRDQTLSIYGKFPAGTKEVVIQVTGTSADKRTNEFIFRGSIKKARQVSQDLNFDWIAQKVFYLVVANTLNPSPEIEAELQALKRRYNLQIPYL